MHPFPASSVIKKYYDTIWESQIVTAVVYLILSSRIYYCLGTLWAIYLTAALMQKKYSFLQISLSKKTSFFFKQNKF